MRKRPRLPTTILLALATTLWLAEAAWALAKLDNPHLRAERGIPALALLVLTLAYAAIHRRWGLHGSGLPLLAISSLCVLHILPAWINGLHKGFAPLTPAEAEQAFRSGWVMIIAVGLLATLSCLAVARVSAKQAAARVAQTSCR